MLAITHCECQMCFSGFWSHAIRQYHVCLQNNQPIHCWEGDIRLLHTSSGPTSSQFDTSGFEKPVAFSKVSENFKFHCELRYFHFTESLSVSCQERFQRLLRVAQAQRWRSLGFALEIIAEAVVKDSFFAADTSDFCLKCTLGNG